MVLQKPKLAVVKKWNPDYKTFSFVAAYKKHNTIADLIKDETIEAAVRISFALHREILGKQFIPALCEIVEKPAIAAYKAKYGDASQLQKLFQVIKKRKEITWGIRATMDKIWLNSFRDRDMSYTGVKASIAIRAVKYVVDAAFSVAFVHTQTSSNDAAGASWKVANIAAIFGRMNSKKDLDDDDFENAWHADEERQIAIILKHLKIVEGE